MYYEVKAPASASVPICQALSFDSHILKHSQMTCVLFPFCSNAYRRRARIAKHSQTARGKPAQVLKPSMSGREGPYGIVRKFPLYPTQAHVSKHSVTGWQGPDGMGKLFILSNRSTYLKACHDGWEEEFSFYLAFQFLPVYLCFF